MRRLVITNANIYTPVGTAGKRGAEMGDILHIEKGGIIIEDGIIRWVGPDSEMPEPEGHVRDEVYMDALGRAVLPGFVDSHTHLVFGGYRPEEFGWRLKGDTYMSIMERGGGIQSTVNATRAASAEELREKAEWYLDEMSAMGVTTVEAKSGYGLDTETEERMLRVIKELAEDPERKVDVVSTFLGAHAVPKEYKGRTAEYVDLIIKEMLPRFRDMAEFCDIFTEKNVFELEDSRRLLEAAREAGYKLKMHADEIVSLGGAELAADLGAVSADHLLHVSDEGIRRMAESGTVATLLPLTAFALKEEFAPARKFIDAGCTVALATDLNPGSCFSGSIPLTIALACIYMKMSVEETLTALTLNGAAAIDRAARIGSIEAGKQGDVVILHFDTLDALPYYVGMNCVDVTIKNGIIL
jgi:imidazolonepropionase